MKAEVNLFTKDCCVPAKMLSDKAFKRSLLKKIENDIRKGAIECSHNPLEWYFEPSTRCNIGCRTCGRLYDSRFKEKGFTGNMAYSIVEKAAPHLENSFLVHSVGFGEPFMNPRIFDIFKIIKQYGPLLDVITNGTLLAGKIDALIDCGLDFLVVSMDGGTKEVFEQFRLGAQWEVVVQNLNSLKAARKVKGVSHPQVWIQFVAMRENIRTLPKLVELSATEWGASSLSAEPLFQTTLPGYIDFFHDQNLSNLPFEEVDSLLRKARSIAKKHRFNLTGPYFLGDPRELWEGSHIQTMYFIDHPQAGTLLTEIKAFYGWAAHPKGVKEVRYRINSEEQGIAVRTSRGDVARAVSAGLNLDGEDCGFGIPVQSLIEGENRLQITIMDNAGGVTEPPPVVFTFDSAKHQDSDTGSTHAGEANPPGPQAAEPGAPEDDTAPRVEVARSEQQQAADRDPSRKTKFSAYCTYPWTMIYITHTGEVRSCCFCEDEPPMGDLNHQSFEEIWNGKKYRQLREDILAGKVPDICRSCVANARTHGRSLFDKYGQWLK